jgi:hypothetical protein
VYAMQYEITLPADYDMGIIRRRVATRGHLMDDFAGLGMKAYLVRERGVDASSVNQYAPFYLWDDVAGMSRFLFEGGGFNGIVRDFGRPRVRHWTGVGVVEGAQAGTRGELWAWKSVEALPADVDPAQAVAEARRDAQELAGSAHTVAVGVDPSAWELVRFALSVGAPVQRPGTRYRVLHVSAPRQSGRALSTERV